MAQPPQNRRDKNFNAVSEQLPGKSGRVLCFFLKEKIDKNRDEGLNTLECETSPDSMPRSIGQSPVLFEDQKHENQMNGSIP